MIYNIWDVNRDGMLQRRGGRGDARAMSPGHHDAVRELTERLVGWHENGALAEGLCDGIGECLVWCVLICAMLVDEQNARRIPS